jgi:hypothetical protein
MSDKTATAAKCVHHSSTIAKWWCATCNVGLCDRCVQDYHSGGVAIALCRKCKRSCRRIEAGPQEGADDRVFHERLPGVLAYPFSGQGWILLLIGSVCFWILGFIAQASIFGFVMQWLIGGYLAGYMLKILSSSANDEPQLPSWPDLTDLWDDLIRPIFLLAALVAFSFLPAIAWGLKFQWGDGPFWTLLTLGLLYLPMGMIAIALWDSIAALNPMLIVPAIAHLPFNYLLACLGLVAAVMIEWAFQSVSDLIPFAGSLIGHIIGLFVLAVEMRILGLLYFTNRRVLGWFV